MLNVVNYILDNKIMRQIDLANELGVSRGQISKWNKEETIPHAREKELLKIAGLFGYDFEWAYLTKTEENGNAWIKYVREVNRSLDTPCVNLTDSPEVPTKFFLKNLKEFDICIPEISPIVANLDSDFNFSSENKFEYLFKLLIRQYSHLSNWVHNNVVIEDVWEIESLHDAYAEIEHASTIDIAIANLSEDIITGANGSLEKFRSFSLQARYTARKNIKNLLHEMTESKIPFKANYFDFIDKGSDGLEIEDEYHQLFESNRIEGYFSYAEKETIRRSGHIRTLLEELHIKIDFLLPEDAKKILNEQLELTKPVDNPYLAKE
jgi:transcriptional regulator with XRE-family HTH domain